MNKKFKMLTAGIILCAVSITVTRVDNSIDTTHLMLGEIESLASCEVTKNGKVIFQCSGETENNCKDKYKSVFTGEVSIECSGTYVEN